MTQGGKVLAHKMVAKTAKGIAEHFYEQLAKNNDFYRDNPDENAWVSLAWPAFLEEARATLARMLTTAMNEELKTTISDALINDNVLRTSRRGIAQITTESKH